MFMTAFVRSSLDGSAQLVLGPWLGADFERGTVTLVVREEALC